MAPSHEMIGRVLGGRYRLRALVGTGASARVYLADDTTLDRQVAVKVLHDSLAHDETFLRRFRQEAYAAAKLNHPNVLAVYDWRDDDPPYIVNEYLAGGSLRAMLDAGHRLSSSQALMIGLEAARGLEYAHRRGLVHRDIKPANLLFDEERRLRIADFGLARAIAEAGLTEPSGSIVGTLRYASPEQAKGETLTGKTDVYSLALVLIECVTGEVPFADESPAAMLLARLERPIHVPAELGPLRPALARAGDPDPTRRPDAEELSIAFMAAAEDLRRPDPLPIVGALAPVDPTARVDATTLAPLPGDKPGAAAAAGTGLGSHDVTRAYGSATVAGSDPTLALARDPAQDDTAPAIAKSKAWRGREKTSDQTRAAVEDDGPQRRWPWVLLGVLLLAGAVAGGAYAYLANRTITHVMPNVVGQPASELQALATKNHWVLAEPDQINSDEYEKGDVSQVSPAPGAKVAEGATVSYTVVIGPVPITIPTTLVGSTLDVAKAELERVGLKLGEPLHDFSETVEKGKIISVETVGAKAEPGTAIVVKVSDGPKQRTVPDPTNLAEAAYNAKLAELGLTPVHAEEFSETVAAGTVIRVDPAPGTAVDRGAQVQVVVSKGPEPRAVPNVFGMSASAAAAALREKGFTVGDTRGPADRPVIGTDPPAGEVKPKGTVVNIITRTT